MATYLQSLLASQELTPAEHTGLDAHKDEVEKFLRQEFGQDPVIKIAGSLSKGTAIKESYDLDIVVYFPDSDTRSLKQIYDDVDTKLSGRYTVELKNSAIRIHGLKTNEQNQDYHIDVVPGRFITGSKDVFLHIRNGDKERMQTNLKTHIEYVTKSDCQDAIKLVKIWKKRNNLSLRTFILELLVIRALDGYQSKTNPEMAFTKAMGVFSTSMKVELTDPANTNNVVSKLLSDQEKDTISRIAAETLKTINETNPNKWEIIFRGNPLPRQSIATPAPITINRPPSKPWLA